MKCGTLAPPPDAAIRGWAKVRPFPFVSLLRFHLQRSYSLVVFDEVRECTLLA